VYRFKNILVTISKISSDFTKIPFSLSLFINSITILFSVSAKFLDISAKPSFLRVIFNIFGYFDISRKGKNGAVLLISC